MSNVISIDQTPVEIAEQLVTRIINEKDVSACYGDALIEAIAVCPRVKRMEFQKRLDEAFEKEFRPSYWKEKLKVAVEALQSRLGVTQPAQEGQPDLLPQDLNDGGNASRFLALHGDNVLYCPPEENWFIWDGRRWKSDDKNVIQELAVDAMKQFKSQVESRSAGDEALYKFAVKSGNASGIRNLLELASSRVPVMPEALDKDPWALNCLNGTVDLRTKAVRPHSREDKITKLVEHDYDPFAPTENWGRFIGWTMGVSPDASTEELDRADRYLAYLQRAIGYSITGTTREKAFFVTQGVLNTGKSTAIQAIRAIFSEYCVTVPIETFLLRNGQSNKRDIDLARMLDARIVISSEAEKGPKLDTALLKQLTAGQGTTTGRALYKTTREDVMKASIWIDTNEVPDIRNSDDEALIERMHIIPFSQQVTDVDTTLPQKFLAEGAGIVAWCVEGAAAYYAACGPTGKQGLGRPAEMDEARAEWRKEMDQLGRWIDERCVLGVNCSGYSNSLYADYKKWAEDGTEYVMSQKMFAQKMKLKKFPDDRSSGKGTRYSGIGLRAG